VVTFVSFSKFQVSNLSHPSNLLFHVFFRMNRTSNFLLIFWTLAIVSLASPTSVFVLIGGTGDLSSKYLWDAVFRQIFLKNTNNDSQSIDSSIRVFTSGRSDDVEGKAKLEKILKKMHCRPQDGPSCPENTRKFAQSIEYVKMENDPDYARFCHEIFSGERQIENVDEMLWYLATPPTYYPIILMSIHTKYVLGLGLA